MCLIGFLMYFGVVVCCVLGEVRKIVVVWLVGLNCYVCCVVKEYVLLVMYVVIKLCVCCCDMCR